MPDFEVAINTLPLDRFFAAIDRHDGGIDVRSLLGEFVEQGISRQIVLRVLQSQFDAGAVTLTHDMRVKADRVAEAA